MFGKRIFRLAWSFFSLILHLFAGGVIFYFWRPIAKWYLDYRPILGVDFYNLVSYIGYLARHFAFRVNGWKYIWHAGYPLSLDYPTLHAYLHLPLLKFFNLPQAVQIYALTACFAGLFFSYLVFVQLSRDRVLSIILTLAYSFSLGLYGALVWGGSLPYFNTQFFLPLTVWLLLKFFSGGSERWFFLSSLFLGLSFFGHPQVALSYIMPISFLLLLFYPFNKEKFFSKLRFKRLIVYFLTAIIIGYPTLRLHLGSTSSAILLKKIIEFPRRLLSIRNFLSRSEQPKDMSVVYSLSPTMETARDIAKWNKKQLSRFLSDSNFIFFTFLKLSVGIFLLAFLIRKHKKQAFKVLIFILPAFWIIGYIFLYSYSIDIFHGGWYRVFWPFPLSLGILISFLWGDLKSAIKERLGKLGQNRLFSLFLTLAFSGLVLVYSLPLFEQNSFSKMLNQINTILYRQPSSAFPDSLNVDIDRDKLEQLKSKLVPNWLNPRNTQHRLYEADQRVNIWWNSFFDLPLIKGYIDDPSGDSGGAFYWMSVALTQALGQEALVKIWHTPEAIAKNNALFFLDWFSIKYLEAEHEMSDTYNPLTSYVANADIFSHKEKVIIPGWAQIFMTENEKIIYNPKQELYLTYYEVKNEYVSPICHPSRVAVVGVVGNWDAYNTFVRDLAALNLNSRRIIPLQLGQSIDKVSLMTLKNMDLVILYAYDYRNHSAVWGKLERYVREGGRLIIETGSEVKETRFNNLPAIFPINSSKREEMGKEWQLTSYVKETQGIDFSKFTPPLSDDKPWMFSLPGSASDLREGARVILANKGIPLIVARKFGSGEIVWSGMNLPHHVASSKSLEEAKFFEKLLTNYVEIKEEVNGDFQVERPSSQKVIIKASQARGVVFNEQAYPGWTAKIKSGGESQRLKIYRTGPIAPGFHYVIVPKEFQNKEFEVTFAYLGNFWSYFWQLVSIIAMLIVFEQIIFAGRFIIKPLTKKVKSWWGKEGEY